MQIGAVPQDSVPWMTVVGVGDVKQALATDVATEMYVPYRQANEVLPVRTMSVVMRTEVDPQLLIPELRETVRRINPDQPVVRIRTMEENVTQNLSQPRFRAELLLIFAGLALPIASVGVYGVMAYSTAQRAGEMAIRMALGCSVRQIFRLVLTDGLRLTLIGVAMGTALSQVLGHWLKVRPHRGRRRFVGSRTLRAFLPCFARGLIWHGLKLGGWALSLRICTCIRIIRCWMEHAMSTSSWRMSTRSGRRQSP